jgi:hypothetical protein
MPRDLSFWVHLSSALYAKDCLMDDTVPFASCAFFPDPCRGVCFYLDVFTGNLRCVWIGIFNYIPGKYNVGRKSNFSSQIIKKI